MIRNTSKAACGWWNNDLDCIHRAPRQSGICHRKGKTMIYVIASINLCAVIVMIVRRALPHPFPWAASALLAIVLLLGGLVSPHAGIERGVGFVTLLSSVIITSALIRYRSQMRMGMIALSVLLTAFLLADALRLIPTPDIQVTSGETFGIIRRPYLLEHPNLKACWLLLLSLSPITLIGIIAAQSRGALLGYIVAFIRYIPRRYYIHALVIGMAVMSAAAWMRPNTFFWRWDIWSEAIKLFLSSPLIGFGTGSYIAHTQTGMTVAHNVALTIAAENGSLGLLALALWIIPAGKYILTSSHPAKYNLIAFAVQQIVDDQWLQPVTAIILGVVIAICVMRKETV
jgi:hypothetical protein